VKDQNVPFTRDNGGLTASGIKNAFRINFKCFPEDRNMDVGPEQFYSRYQDLQRYVGWNDDDAMRLRGAGSLVAPSFTVRLPAEGAQTP
jgi:hypothetical protein